MNPNTRSYWERRFSVGDWAERGGAAQTEAFANSQVARMGLPDDFSGSITDFGCGTGDAIPVYRRHFPAAKLTGVDFAQPAIDQAQRHHGRLASFVCGDVAAVPPSDVIVCSNVFEHLDNDEDVLRALLQRCNQLFVTVPYHERPLSMEHVREYGDNSFGNFPELQSAEVFKSRGWSFIGWEWVYQIALKNVARVLLGRRLVRQRYQVMYRFNGHLSSRDE